MERPPSGPGVPVETDIAGGSPPADPPEQPVAPETPPTAAPQRGDWLIARLPFLVALGIGIYFAVGSYDLDIGSLRAPDSGLWPFIVSVILISCSVGGMFAADRADIEPFDRTVIRPLLGLIVLCLFVVLFEETGLLLTGSLVLFFWFKFLAREGWLMAVALAVGASTVAYLLFVVILGARLPDDLIAQLWGGR
jgi:hypothetical protein